MMGTLFWTSPWIASEFHGSAFQRYWRIDLSLTSEADFTFWRDCGQMENASCLWQREHTWHLNRCFFWMPRRCQIPPIKSSYRISFSVQRVKLSDSGIFALFYSLNQLCIHDHRLFSVWTCIKAPSDHTALFWAAIIGSHEVGIVECSLTHYVISFDTWRQHHWLIGGQLAVETMVLLELKSPPGREWANR
jgi:hypothetical protein